MRTALLCLLFVLLGCDSARKSPTGDATTGTGDAHPTDSGGIDGARVCDPSLECTEGPLCGATCCGAGEHCEGTTCMCGSGPACDTAHTGNTCNSGGGATVAPAATCGILCCGGTIPCPV